MSQANLVVGEVWLSQYTGNYFRIDEIDGPQVTVTRLGYVENIGQPNEKNFISRSKIDTTPYFWNLATFNSKDFRRIARKAIKFESWLNTHAANTSKN